MTEDSILVSEMDMAGDGEGTAADTVVRERFPAEVNPTGRMLEAWTA